MNASPFTPTESQQNASRENAQASTGPRTPDGKRKSAQNSTTHGLTTALDFVRPEERNEYLEFVQNYQSELSPATTLEGTYTGEITSASWRLRRCRLIESTSNLNDESTQRAIDRARAHAHNTLRRSLAELRKLQTERQIRSAILPDPNAQPDLGLASLTQVLIATNKHERARPAAKSLIQRAMELPALFCNSPEPTPTGIARNSLCPCNSGQKYKRCCGINAPAVLTRAA